MPFSSRARGFALIELLLVLGVGVVMMIAVWATFAQRNQDLKVSQSFDTIEQLGLLADSAYSTSPGYWLNGPMGAEPVTLQKLQSVIDELPETIIDQGGGNYTNPWAGAWTVGAANSVAGTNDLLVMTMAGLPTQACITLVSRMAPRQYDTRVNGTLVGLTPARTTTANGRSAVRGGQLIPLCQQNQNTVIFRRMKPVDYTLLRDQPMNPNTLTTGTGSETERYLPVFQRVEQAMAAREAAQVALP